MMIILVEMIITIVIDGKQYRKEEEVVLRRNMHDAGPCDEIGKTR